MQLIQTIQNRIYEIRDQRVMLDKDLAALYETETKVFNLAVKRNIIRFPPDFMFQLTAQEYENLRFQFETSSSTGAACAPKKTGWGGTRYLPFAFTEQGVAMLSGVLHSEKAINMNISIMRAFVEVRKTLLMQADWREQLRLIKDQLGMHDAQLNQIYDAMENLLDEKAAQRKWDDRERIGFKR
jgi:hypothetical protein